MTEERIVIIEKYLGSKTSTGLLVQAWHELRGALSNLHASLVLAHCTPDQVAERGKILEDKSQEFAAVYFNMHVELELEPELAGEVYKDGCPGLSTPVGSDFLAQTNEPALEPEWCPAELGGEG